ncbi:MAG: hypothetical protein KGJ36_01300 [Acidobacteriota bacterium]|nr:hypothetical protein [Acidobacteriota bacterium]
MRAVPRVATRLRGAAVAALALASWLAPATAGATGTLPPANPPANIAPVPDFLSSGSCTQSGTAFTCANPCVSVRLVKAVAHLVFPTYDDSAACVAFFLRSLDAARASEGLGPLTLPTNWSSLTIPEQLFVVADLERVDRGLPPYLGLNAKLSATARAAARSGRDPLAAAGFFEARDRGTPAYGSTWASGYSALGADYVWMYDDGWGGPMTPNRACTSAGAHGCWGHRDELLGADPGFNPGVGLACTTCEMGAGFALFHHGGAFADLVERPAGPPPPMYFTWARDVKPYLAH